MVTEITPSPEIEALAINNTPEAEGSTVASDGILICHKVLPTWDCPKAHLGMLRSATVQCSGE